MEKFGFVYIWYDRKHKRYYVGSHWGTEDDGYICSQDNMRNNYNNRIEDFRRRIIKRVFTNSKDLRDEEQRYLNMINPGERGGRYYNKSLSAIYPLEREELSAISKALHNDLDYRTKYEEGLLKRDNKSSDPDVREKRRASMIATMAKKYPVDTRKKRMKFGSEEYREFMRQSSSKMWTPERRKRHGKLMKKIGNSPPSHKGKPWSKTHRAAYEAAIRQRRR